MKKIHFALQLGMPFIGLVMTASVAFAQASPTQTTTIADANRMAESIQFYRQMHAELSHPRCINCHAKDDKPKQGLDSHVHLPPITRAPVPAPKAEFDRVEPAWVNSDSACPD